MERFGSPAYSLILTPRPGERESRFPKPRDRHMHRPKEDAHVRQEE